MNLLALIPHYNHPSTVGSVAHALRDFGLDVLIVDDGSREDCRPVFACCSASATAAKARR